MFIFKQRCVIFRLDGPKKMGIFVLQTLPLMFTLFSQRAFVQGFQLNGFPELRFIKRL